MSIMDKALKANQTYAGKYDRKLEAHPTPNIAVVTCIDARISDLLGILGLPHVDIDVIRTDGPTVTEDVLGELVVSTRVLGTTGIMLLNHTGWGFTTFTADELNAKLSALTGDASRAPMRFFSYMPCASLSSTWAQGDCAKSEYLNNSVPAGPSLLVVHRPHNSCFRNLYNADLLLGKRVSKQAIQARWNVAASVFAAAGFARCKTRRNRSI